MTSTNSSRRSTGSSPPSGWSSPESAPLFDGRDDPANQEAGRAVIRDLRARAVANADRIRRVRTSDPELQAIRDALGRAQAGQIDRLDALGRYLETGDPAALAAAREALAVTLEAMRDCEGQHVRYMTRHGLIPPPEPHRASDDRAGGRRVPDALPADALRLCDNSAE